MSLVQPSGECHDSHGDVVDHNLVRQVLDKWEVMYSGFSNVRVHYERQGLTNSTSTPQGDCTSCSYIASSADFGRSLRLRTFPVRKGELVYVDCEPLIVMQHQYSRRCCFTCLNCCRIVGDLRSHGNRILSNDRKSLERNYPKELQIINSELNGQPAYPPPAVTCETCDEVFCSKSCLEACAVRGHHRILCTEASDSVKKNWKAFCRHAKEYSEHFILAGLVYAKIICMVKHLNEPLDQVMAKFSAFYTLKNWHSLRSGTAWKTDASKKLVSDESRMKILRESLELLRHALLPQCLGYAADGVNVDWTPLFHDDFYDKLMGQFDLVNLEVEIENPMNALITKNQKLVETCQPLWQELYNITNCATGASLFSDDPTSPDMADVFGCLLGIGLYRVVALSNHSCDPNVEAEFRDNCAAHVVALRDIAVDEEITLVNLVNTNTL
eukprot:GHVQ01023338.1.p1 GENE.GHVQ01023338.1~~GHVQ01023338.1.p1  ORF type:complete len:441 (-),score=34.81 GHVQ01023338.1:938-2260(-)